MATLLTPLPLSSIERSANSQNKRHALALATALTPLALLIHGFHPNSEDGGIYLAGAQRLLHPGLFPHFTEFVLAPTRHSLFARMLAALARTSHLTTDLRFAALVLALHLATIWTTLLAASLLAHRCWPTAEARTGAVLLLTCWLGLPIAGTSLLFVDPYLTARSFSTPCLIFALIGTLDATSDRADPFSSTRRDGLILWIVAIIVASLLHPLMAGYALLASLALAACRLPERTARRSTLAALAGFALVSSAAIFLLAPHDTPGYTAVALSRGYWFVSRWRWYEWVGIVAPTAILALFSRRPADGLPRSLYQPTSPARALAQAAAFCAVLVTSVSLLFAHPHDASHLVAALQPMRGLQFAYLAMTLSLGAALGRYVLRRNPVTWAAAALLIAAPLFAAARASSPGTSHLELPARDSGNSWISAFAWIRTHTPADALFALPSNYISLPGEDAHCFRAIAQRSALPDYSKDGGEASVAPALTPLWILGQSAQSTLATDSDQLRRAKLVPLGVSWLVLPTNSATHLDCPYSNSAARVCRLR